MTRKYSLVVEGDSSGYSAYVPELPTILISGSSLEDID
jgi:predicted RNase H-like HicB family nuclease